MRGGYDAVIADAKTFDGWMAPLSVALFFSLLKYQDGRNITGNIVEFGVFRGKSASVLLHMQTPHQPTYLIDIKDYPELDKLRAINPNFQFIQGKSEEVVSDLGRTIATKSVRFSHHDASHSFNNLEMELDFIEDRLADGGIAALDDFGNWNYSQVVAATYAHIFAKKSDLEVFLISENKAYLCRRSQFQAMANFILSELPLQLKELGFNVYVGRTDKETTSRAFYVGMKKNEADADLFGVKIYGDRFYQPNKEVRP